MRRSLTRACHSWPRSHRHAQTSAPLPDFMPYGPRPFLAASHSPAHSKKSVSTDGEVLEIDPGRRVVMAFHPRWSPEIEAEDPVRMTWAIEPGNGDVAPTRLVVTTAIVPGTHVAVEFPGGNELIVSGLKTFLETGAALAVA